MENRAYADEADVADRRGDLRPLTERGEVDPLAAHLARVRIEPDRLA